jgi:hypothetical protein
MKAFIVLALLFAVNSSFLRELDGPTAATVTDVTFVQNCTVDGEVTITAATSVEALTGKFNATLTSGKTADDFMIPDGTGATGSIGWKFTPSTQNTGIYKVKSIVEFADTAAFTVTVGDNITSTLMISVAAVHNATQDETQEIEEGKAFTIQFNETMTKVPFIYAASDAKAPIADCSIDATNAKIISCKPTKEEMKGKDEFTIHYKNGCEASLVATKVKVKFSEDSSAFMTLGKVALFALAFLF